MTRSRDALLARRAAVAMARAVLVPLWLCWALGCAAPPNVVLLLMDDVSAGRGTLGWEAPGPRGRSLCPTPGVEAGVTQQGPTVGLGWAVRGAESPWRCGGRH